MRIAYARVRYDVGIAVEHALRSRSERFPRLFRWACESESRQNCIIDPWLGRAVKLEKSERRRGRLMVSLAEQIKECPGGKRNDRLRRRYSRIGVKAAAAMFERARHQLRQYPADQNALAILRLRADMHQR